jgi:CheY-like chemotaxis protein
MWSGNMDAVLRQKLISKGADACLSKPTQNDALIEILGRLADWTRSGLRAGPAPG